MLSSLRISQIYVLDQDQAVDFYVGKLGLEINTDQDLGFMRFLTVSLPGDPDRQIMLEKPGPPAMDPATADEVRSLLTKGRTGGHLFFTTSDARKAYDELAAKGVEFTQTRSAITSALRRCRLWPLGNALSPTPARVDR